MQRQQEWLKAAQRQAPMVDEEAPPPPPPPPQQQEHPPSSPPVMSSGGVHLRAALQLEGLAYLLLVALLWGSYMPALR